MASKFFTFFNAPGVHTTAHQATFQSHVPSHASYAVAPSTHAPKPARIRYVRPQSPNASSRPGA
jgi:hypothetical protein